jgi:hypothetical protein
MAMKLLTKEILNRLPPLYSQENNPDPIVHVKFFDPTGSWTWFAYEGSQEGDDFIFFGLVKGFEDELGNFSLNELAKFRGKFGLGIERDRYFKPVPLSQIPRRN